MQAKRIDLSACLIGGEIIGEPFGQSVKAQKNKLMKQIEDFFQHQGQIIALETDISHLHTSAHLNEREQNPITWDDVSLCISTKFKVFEWLFDEGKIHLIVTTDALTLHQYSNNNDGDETITHFVRW